MALQYYSITKTGQKYSLDKATGAVSQVSAIPAGGATVTWGGDGLPPELQNKVSSQPPAQQVQQTLSSSQPASYAPQKDQTINYDPSDLGSMQAAYANLQRTAGTQADYNLLSSLGTKIQAEQSRQAGLTQQAQQIASGGGGSAAINNFYSSLSPKDQQLVHGYFGNNIISGYTAPNQNTQTTVVTQNGIMSGIPTGNMQPGQSGDSVKQLQTWLIQNGYNIPDGATGFYGPETKAAVASLQQKLGVVQPGAYGSGFWGPQTQSALTSQSQGGTQQGYGTSGSASTATQASTEGTGGGAGGTSGSGVTFNGKVYDLGNAQANAALGAALGYITTQQAQGNVVNPHLDITPELIGQFISEAHQQVDPYYQNILTQNIDQINAGLKTLGSQYQNDQAGQQAQYQQGIANEREAAAGAGTAFSGGRGLNEQNMQSAQNRSLSAIDTGYGQKFGDLLRQGAGLVGNGTNSSGLNGSTASFQLPNLFSQGATLEGPRGGASQGSRLDFAGYNPGDYNYGSLISGSGGYGDVLNKSSNSFLTNYLNSASNNSARTFQNVNGTPTLM